MISPLFDASHKKMTSRFGCQSRHEGPSEAEAAAHLRAANLCGDAVELMRDRRVFGALAKRARRGFPARCRWASIVPAYRRAIKAALARAPDGLREKAGVRP